MLRPRVGWLTILWRRVCKECNVVERSSATGLAHVIVTLWMTAYSSSMIALADYCSVGWILRCSRSHLRAASSRNAAWEFSALFDRLAAAQLLRNPRCESRASQRAEGSLHSHFRLHITAAGKIHIYIWMRKHPRSYGDDCTPHRAAQPTERFRNFLLCFYTGAQA